MLKIPVVCYSRVSGYYSDVSQFNRGKKSELKQRKMLKIPSLIPSISGAMSELTITICCDETNNI
jgi:hypothetical protein